MGVGTTVGVAVGSGVAVLVAVGEAVDVAVGSGVAVFAVARETDGTDEGEADVEVTAGAHALRKIGTSSIAKLDRCIDDSPIPLSVFG